MKASPAVAKSYAKALFELARERRQAEQVEGELDRAVAVVAGDGALAAVLGRPWITPANKRRLAEEIGQGLELSQLGAFRVGRSGSLGGVRARVRTAVALNDAERAALSARLSGALGGKKVLIEEVVDKNLLGGFVAEIGSLVVDGSLDGQLGRLRDRLVHG